MIRVNRFLPNRAGFEVGLIIEVGAVAGLWDPQILIMGSGVLEWVRKYFFGYGGGVGKGYKTMVSEADKAGPGAGGVMVVRSFVAGAGLSVKGCLTGAKIGYWL